MSKLRIAALLLLSCLVLSGIIEARARRKFRSFQFSYYLLVLSYAPDFCDQPRVNKDPRECGAGRHMGFVVHGLWPEGETSHGPENCGPASPLPPAIIQPILNYIPSESLIRHEWAAHGTCSGLSAADYFGALRQARDSIKLPADLSQPSQRLQLSPAEIESKMAMANASFPKTAFRTSCYRDGKLQEIRACFTKNLSPRACSISAGECSAGQVTLLPVR